MTFPKITSSENVFHNNWINVRHDKLIFEDDVYQDYFVIDSNKKLTAILAITDNKEIVLVEQYRHPLKKITVDIPGGSVEKDESVLDAAKRELLEETGYSAGELFELFSYYPDSGQKECVKHVFLARRLEKKESKPDVTEKMHVILKNIEEIYQDVLSGELREPTLMTAVLLAKQKGII